ncbi:SusC/RagA family TonB-linked outer membrane protein [Arcticibacter tournemirensis]|nr:TonB-dependent receptor [Arcticibacter tournemirensis]
MKLTLALILILNFQALASVYSQTKVTLNLKSADFKQVLSAIEKKSSYRFVFSERKIPSGKKMDINVTNEDVMSVLDHMLENSLYTYNEMANGLVAIVPKGELFSEVRISGKVVDETGQPLPGASVKVKGSTSGVSTDINGSFSLNVPENAVLVISYIGYQVQEVTVKGKASNFSWNYRFQGQEVTVRGTEPFAIKLLPLNNSLNEVVVVGYGTQKAANLTGSVATVSAKTLDDRPLTNIAQGLQGTMPGLTVSMVNGSPGQGATFKLRGQGTLSGNESPLVLVDGVVMDPNLVNPEDVESVTVLKDAASAAIYGGRGAFGVILIKTKGGKEGKTSVTYSGNYSLSRPTRMPEYLNGPEYINMFRDAVRRAGGNSYNYTDEDSIRAAAYLADPGSNLPVYPDPANPRKYRYVGSTDWIDVLYPGYQPQQQHNLSLAGGEGKTSYMASLGYFNQEGLLKEADQQYDRYNATLKLNNSTTKWMDLNFKATLNHSSYDTPNGTQFVNETSQTWSFIPTDLTPLMPVYHPDGNFSGQGNYTNMVALMKQNGRQKYDINDLWLTGGVVLKPIRNVRIVADYTWNGYFYNKTQHYKAFNEYGVDGVLLGTYPWTSPSRLYQTNSSDTYYALNGYAEYENTFAKKHYFKAMVGYNEEMKKNRSFNATAKNLIDPTLESLVPNYDPNPTVGGSLSEWAVSGSFFRLNYIYDDKYLLEVNGRYDGTSRFSRGDRYLFVPSVSAGWRVSEEKFFEKWKGYVNNLKLRGSMGTSGNQATSTTYPYIATMPTGQTGYVFDNGLTSPYVGAPTLVNPGFTWEKVETFNLGLDASFLKNRLGLSFDRYRRATKDMLYASAPLPAVLGANPPQTNSVDLKTTGWELNLTWNDRVGDDFNYSVGLNLSDYTSKITKFELNPTNLLSTYYNGYKLGDQWGYTTAGFFKSAEEISKSASQKEIWNGTWLPGDIRYADLDGNGTINQGDNTLQNPGDRRVIGNTTPRYQFGLNLSADYKGFDATLFFQGIMKRDAWLYGTYFWGLTDEWSVPLKYNLDTWTPQNPDAYYPVNKIGAWYNQMEQTKYRQNAAYARLKQVTLGYTLPKALTGRAKISRARVYVTGQNLFEITELHDAFDPEVLNGQTYPLSRSIAFGLQIGL